MALTRPDRNRFLVASVPALAVAALLAASEMQVAAPIGAGQELLRKLLAESPAQLAADARRSGDPMRGAVIFFQPELGCAKCHDHGPAGPPLGPDLAKSEPNTIAEYLVESILQPSKKIKDGFASVVVHTSDGRALTGILAQDSPESLVLRDASRNGELISIPKGQIDEHALSRTSVMPEGLAAGLASRQEFLDLVRYLIELAEHGPERARELRPAGVSVVVRTPAYEQNIDHAGMLRDLGDASFRRGKEIYELLCINCHGTKDRPGSLPTSLRFAADKFKNGSDPYSLYRTLTYGFGMMLPQTWMVPQQKYDVIHYIREAYLKEHNPSQYVRIDRNYFDRLPRGTERGPEPVRFEPWLVMDYGPSLIHTYEIPRGPVTERPAAEPDGAQPMPDGDRTPPNLAYKGIAVRLDAGSGGIARGQHWLVWDHDTLRMAGAWSKEADSQSFIDWEGVMFNGRHAVHPRARGRVHLANSVGPGWANPEDGRFNEPRLRGRDGRPYGPLPRAWAHYQGIYHYGQQVVIAYTIGSAQVLEMPGVSVASKADGRNETIAYTRTFNIGARDRPMTLQVAELPSSEAPPRFLAIDDAQAPNRAHIIFGHEASGGDRQPVAPGAPPRLIAAGLEPPVPGARWLSGDSGQLRLQVPAGPDPVRFTLWAAAADSVGLARQLATQPVVDRPGQDLTLFTHGGPSRWPTTLTTAVRTGQSSDSFGIDVLTHPADNPWLCRTRFTGFDFFPDRDQLAICSWDGDVWLVSGFLDTSDGRGTGSSGTLSWRRIASGLFQPLGLKIIDGQIYVGCRDQIVILRDLNGDGETDFYENFNNDHQVTEHFHEFAMGLQTDAEGNLYYAKSARHALPALVPQHGTLLRVAKDGSRTDILANGFRAANGVCLNPDGSFIVTDQEGHWNPKNRINWVTANSDGSPTFYGNMFGYHDVTDASDAAMEQPLCWITNAFDRSPAELLWITSERWGPLRGSLLNLSYGYGKVFVVLHERVGGQVQGGMCELPFAPFPTGVMRGRFHSVDGQLYLCGMFAWAGSATEPGGFYRVRYTGKPPHVPVGLEARPGGIAITFTDPLDRATASAASNYSVRHWTLRRSATYGSEHYDERPLDVAGADVSSDGRTVFLKIPGLEPSQCMAIQYRLRASDGSAFSGQIHNTIHALRDR
jgi:putative heme-binding domain-containing protein